MFVPDAYAFLVSACHRSPSNVSECVIALSSADRLQHEWLILRPVTSDGKVLEPNTLQSLLFENIDLCCVLRFLQKVRGGPV